MKVSIYSPTHLGATITAMYLARIATEAYETVGFHTEGDDYEIYGGCGDRVVINPAVDLAVHVYDHWVEGADLYIPVVTNDYRSLRKVVGDDMDYVICVDGGEERALRVTDVKASLSVTNEQLLVIRYSPRIQRACDAGLLTYRTITDGGLVDACSVISTAITNRHTV